MDSLTLTKKLISLPSFVGNKTDEDKLGNYLYRLFSFQKQAVAKNRFNLIFFGNQPKLLVVGHLDTVPPQPGWKSDPFKPFVRNSRLYGLGAADMKGSLAAFLTALINLKNKIELNKLALLFYVDEEYSFLGMKTFIKSRSVQIKPRLVLSLDGDLEIQSGCCGCIELNLKFIGKSGHSAEPDSGINAITKTVAVINRFKSEINDTVNLAYLNGGKKLDGNIIPAECFITLEIRPSTKKVTAARVINRLQQLCLPEKLSLQVLKIRHDLSPWVPANTKYPRVSGYVDVAMLNQAISAPIIVYGAGGANEHGPNEYLPIKNLAKAEKFYQKILLRYCRK